MREATPKERMLKQIRRALIEKTENPYPRIDEHTSVFKKSEEELLEIQFAEEFSKINGKFVFCESREQCLEDLQALIQKNNWSNIYAWEKDLLTWLKVDGLKTDEADFLNANVGITYCEALSARTGSILMSSGTEAGRRLSIYPHIHIVIAYSYQLFDDINTALTFIEQKYEGKLPSMISNTTGPSRTADIEKTLVLGAHGPREIYLFLIDE
jgi:L-lactate dehydrogenase complex protein LldG